jgi:hypothetical protein
MSKITYAAIEKNFSKDDLVRYNSLCREFVQLTSGKNNIELWNFGTNCAIQRITLDDIAVVDNNVLYSPNTLRSKRLPPGQRLMDRILILHDTSLFAQFSG